MKVLIASTVLAVSLSLSPAYADDLVIGDSSETVSAQVSAKQPDYKPEPIINAEKYNKVMDVVEPVSDIATVIVARAENDYTFVAHKALSGAVVKFLIKTVPMCERHPFMTATGVGTAVSLKELRDPVICAGDIVSNYVGAFSAARAYNKDRKKSNEQATSRL